MNPLTILELQIADEFEEINQSMGSVFHGALMGLIDTRYAEYLHTINTRPYSQHLYYDKQRQGWFWHLSSMDEDALMMLLAPASELNSIYIRHKHRRFQIINREVVAQTTFEELLDNSMDENEYLKIRLISPTGFKSNGQYVIYPTPRLVFGSLLNKWNAFSKIQFDAANLMEKFEKLHISGYNLQMHSFGVEGVWIPSFKGDLELSLPKDKDFMKVINTLAMFSNFSGVGIKCALGMGGVKTI